VRYATRAQLAMEERMLAQARGDGAPRLTRADAARVLGVEAERLEHALAGRARHAHDARTENGLREDQSAAALSVLTDGKRVSVINAPAGSGKTRVPFELAKTWESAGLGSVIGITASQSARNTLAAGIRVSYNTAQFLGHLPGRRGARGPVAISPGTLLSVDEASMVSGPELADLISLADANDAKVILAGDTAQLQAVENGGGMSLLADHLGYVQLAEPVRFRASAQPSPSFCLQAARMRACEWLWTVFTSLSGTSLLPPQGSRTRLWRSRCGRDSFLLLAARAGIHAGVDGSQWSWRA
jgi:ATP-dependent exoDNAse (exonuclease V) alpha subunit